MQYNYCAFTITIKSNANRKHLRVTLSIQKPSKPIYYMLTRARVTELVFLHFVYIVKLMTLSLMIYSRLSIFKLKKTCLYILQANKFRHKLQLWLLNPRQLSRYAISKPKRLTMNFSQAHFRDLFAFGFI